MNDFDCTIIGGGIAGSFAAYFLSQAGLSCLLLDSDKIASGASGNHLGSLMPYVTHPSFSAHDLYNIGFDLTSSIVKEYLNELVSAYFSNAVQFPSNQRPKKLFLDDIETKNFGVVVSPCDAASIIGVTPSSPVFIYNNCLVVSPSELCKLLIKKSSAKVIEQSKVLGYTRKNNEFEIITSYKTYNSANVVICNAFESLVFPECAFYSIKKVRGQIVSFQPQNDLARVKVPLGYNGYFLPSRSPSKSVLGTTYDYSFLSTNACPDRNQKMLDNLYKWIPNCGEQKLSIEDTRVSFRTVSKDKLPIAGRISQGVYISIAHGSRGLHSASVCAQYITNLITKQSFRTSVAAAIDPMRKTLN